MSKEKQKQNATRCHQSGPPWHRIMAALAVVLVSACATTQPAPPDIKQRAQARWDALLAGDLDAAYAFYSPGYRSSHSRADFEISLRSRRVQWTSAEVLESSCEADACRVITKIAYRVSGAVPGVPEWKSFRDLDERWVRTEGQWWYLPEN